jgi:hypothetical protein
MSSLIAQFVGWVELARPNSSRPLGDVGSREELDPTYSRAGEVIE